MHLEYPKFGKPQRSKKVVLEFKASRL